MTTSHNRSALAVLAGGNFAQLGVRLLLGALVPLLLVEFETTKSNIGIALTGLWAVYALFQFPSGILADRFGERSLLLLGLFGAVLGAVLVAVSPTLLFFAGATVVMGAGTGLYFSPASSLASRLYEEHGSALSVITGSGAVAGILYPALGSLIGVNVGWRYAVALSILITVPILAATLRVIPSLPPVNPERSLRAAIDLRRQFALLSRRNVVYTIVIAAVAAFFFQGVTSFLPTFLVEYREIDTGLAGILFGVVLGLSAISQPAAGALSDKFSRDFAIGLSVTVAMTGLGLLLAVPGATGLYSGISLLGIGFSWPGPVQARIVDQFSKSQRGYGFGLLRTVYMLIAASSSVIVGTLADHSGWSTGFGFIIMLSIFAVALLCINRGFSLNL